MNYYQLLKEWTAQQPDKLFLVIDGKEWKYQDFLTQTDYLADQLTTVLSEQPRNSGVLVLADTFYSQLLGFFALQRLSVRPILLHHGLPEQEVTAILQENHLQGLLTLVNASDICAIKEFRPACSKTSCLTERAEANEADILGVLSSGSTGTPKVMYRTYESWAEFFPIQNPIFRVTKETKLFLQGSLSFTGNLNSLLSVLYAGGSILTSAKMHCRQWASLIDKYQADVIYLIPTKLQLLTAAVKQPMKSVRSLFTGSQLLSSRNILALKRLLPQARIVLYYGASELNYITYAVCDDPNRDSHNLGRPFPGIDVTVKDGLIYVDTPYHVSGAKIPFTVKDTGYFNEKGELIFEGRRDAWINKGGYKINTLRLENEMRAIDGIREAVVLPCKDALRGSTLAAFVVREQTVEEAAVRAAIRQIFMPVEVPDSIHFLPRMPLNDRGKIDRRSLQALLVSS